MKKLDTNALPDDVEALKKMVLDLQNQQQAEAMQWKSKFYHLLEKWQLELKKRFAASSEGLPGQGDLFNEIEDILQPDEEEVAAEQHIAYTRKVGRRARLDASLPRKEIVHDISDDDKTCECCGTDMHRMGEDVSEKLDFIPAKVQVIRHVRPKYSCRQCEQKSTETPIKQAPVPASMLPKSIATPSLLAQIITAKFQYGLPLYRQEAMFKQFGADISRQNMSRWLVAVSQKLELLYQRMHDLLLQQPVLWADETTLKVIQSEKSKSYMWVYGCGGDKPPPDSTSPPPNIVLYDYQDGRGGVHPKDFLKGYRGPLQVDGYQGYEQTDAVLAGCWAHARRKFMDAKTIQGKNKTGKADRALSYIQKLYRVEKRLAGKPVDELLSARQTESSTIMSEFKEWLEVQAIQVPPTSIIGKAVQYTLNQWSKLQVYLTDGRINIDNNRAERAIKPFVIGRKAWLFANTHGGADASAVLYSLVETAKANDLQPIDYLMSLFEQWPHSKDGDSIDHLLPWNIKLST
ncbi:IS66 family transposase [Alkalimonas collagenimarina]|uniref:IS66 family transposase n=1 Tax=Alkalimonas collagenimarina TaxID=400390 RepID=A0ABT9H2S9_9GAMM|nr:IS66 family transposase [Alkalimonas collagenimarina]MDP4537592.1 IS66 family transposase [Alkalimonas collagenimarina]